MSLPGECGIPEDTLYLEFIVTFGMIELHKTSYYKPKINWDP
jgi:hypothetical protein